MTDSTVKKDTSVGTWSPQQETGDAVTMTEAAGAYLTKQIQKRGQGKGMRLGVKKAGCTGFSYVVDVIDETAPEDHLFPVTADLVIAVDPQSFAFVRGTRIDYVREG